MRACVFLVCGVIMCVSGVVLNDNSLQAIGGALIGCGIVGAVVGFFGVHGGE